MKRTLSLTLVIMSMAAVPAMANLALNGGFELGLDGDADNWNEIQIAPEGTIGSALRTNAMAYEGDWSMMLQVAGLDGSTGPMAEIQNQTPLNSVIPGDAYNFSVMAVAPSAFGPGVVAGMEIQWLDSDGSDGGGIKGSTGFTMLNFTDSYQEYNFNEVIVPTGADAALIMIRMMGGAFTGSEGAVYFDNATLTASVPEPASLALLAIGGLAIIRRR